MLVKSLLENDVVKLRRIVPENKCWPFHLTDGDIYSELKV